MHVCVCECHPQFVVWHFINYLDAGYVYTHLSSAMLHVSPQHYVLERINNELKLYTLHRWIERRSRVCVCMCKSKNPHFEHKCDTKTNSNIQFIENIFCLQILYQHQPVSRALFNSLPFSAASLSLSFNPYFLSLSILISFKWIVICAISALPNDDTHLATVVWIRLKNVVYMKHSNIFYYR